jgi:hypothetical protein
VFSTTLCEENLKTRRVIATSAGKFMHYYDINGHNTCSLELFHHFDWLDGGSGATLIHQKGRLWMAIRILQPAARIL